MVQQLDKEQTRYSVFRVVASDGLPIGHMGHVPRASRPGGPRAPLPPKKKKKKKKKKEERTRGTRLDTRHKMRLVCVHFTFENNTGRTDGRMDGHNLSLRDATAHLKTDTQKGRTRKKEKGVQSHPGGWGWERKGASQMKWKAFLSSSHVSSAHRRLRAPRSAMQCC